MYQLIVYVPDSHLDSLKKALFKAGGGRIGQYDCCAWQALGKGQFRPLTASNAFIGTKNEIATVADHKVERVCSRECIEEVLQALITVHPYETPAYCVFDIKTLNDFNKRD